MDFIRFNLAGKLEAGLTKAEPTETVTCLEDKDILFKHRERTLPKCVLPSGDPYYAEWSSLDKKLDAVGADAKFGVNLQMIPVARLFRTKPWFLGAFTLPIVHCRRPRHPIVDKVMDLESSESQFKEFLLMQEGSSLPSSNALHHEQHFVSRALLITAHRLRTAVAFSNLVQMKKIRAVMGNLLESLDILIETETSARETVALDLQKDEDGFCQNAHT